MKLFAGSDVVKALGINQKLLTQWIDRRLVIPTKKAEGSGDKNKFTLADIIRIGIMKQLADSGFSRPRAASLAFYPDDDSTGVAFSQIINRVLDSCIQAQKWKVEGRPVLSAPIAEQCLLVFFRHAEGKVGAIPYSTAKDLRDLYFIPYETASTIHLTRLIQRIIEVLGTE
jgi:DNA-binding transcriptional MerR regulator